MSEIYILFLLSILCVSASVLVWYRTRQLGAITTLGFVYYFSLYGAWAIISSKSSGVFASWWYLESRLVNIELGAPYTLSLLYYAAFFICVALPFLATPKPPKSDFQPINVSLFRFGLIGWCAIGVSYLLVERALGVAFDMGVSGYSITRFDRSLSLVFGIHQLLNQLGLLCFSSGLAVWFSALPEPVILRPVVRRWPYLLVLIAGLVAGLWFNYALGNKHPLLIALISAALLFEANTRGKRRKSLIIVCLISLGAIGAVNIVRGLPIQEIPSFVSNLSIENLSDVYGSVSSSVEKIAAHVSMYAVLQNNVPPAYGGSIIPLLSSAIPRFIWPDRPEGIYGYYADSISAVSGQGYTIHHATGWYLNFGLIGVLVGGYVLGYILVKIIYSQPRFINSNSFAKRSFTALAPYMSVAMVPALMRNGIEGYKSFFVEGLLLPMILVMLVSRKAECSK